MAATAPADRVEAIDVLRGLALFGVLVVNLVGSFRTSFFEHFLLPDAARAPHDRLADAIIRVALEGKALSIFAFLFGAGLAIQYERFSRWSGAPAALLRRRLIVLLAFGLAHLLLVWNGDILAEYAVLGLAAIPLLEAPEERVRRWIVRLLLASIVLPLAVMPFIFPAPDGVAALIGEADAVYSRGTWLEIRAYSLREFLSLAPVLVALMPQTLALFLAGVIAWRRGYLAEPQAHDAALRRYMLVGLGLGGALTALNQMEPEGLVSIVMLVSLTFAQVLLAMGYAAALILLLRAEDVRRLLRPFAALGRMAFTHYIVQSLVFGFVFFGYGLGLFGHLGTVQALGLGLALYVLQLAFSRWWLGRYRFGPLEWAWRSLTYGEAQPMRR